MTARVTIDALSVLSEFERMAERAVDLTPVLEGPVTGAVLSMFKEVFATEGASIGAKWTPLSRTTLALKGKRRRARMGIGRDSDRLYRSLTIRGATDQIREVTPTSLTLGTSVQSKGAAYPAIFHAGREVRTIFDRVLKRPSHQSARPLIGRDLPSTTRATIEAALGRYVTDGIA